LDVELKRLKELGYRIISGPKPGADNKTIAFLHPADASKVLIELCADSA
jgi:methylmalonyl-CoA/ethylmalonyl-CoA epimerase